MSLLFLVLQTFTIANDCHKEKQTELAFIGHHMAGANIMHFLLKVLSCTGH